MVTYKNYSRGFVSTAVLGTFALLLIAGVHIFESLSNTPIQDNLTASSFDSSNTGNNPGNPNASGYQGSSNTSSGSKSGSTSSGKSSNTGNNPGNSNASGYQGSSNSSGSKSTGGGAAGTNSGSSNAGAAGREGSTSGPGGGANSGGGFGPGPNTASGYSREGSTSGPGGGANSGGGFGPGPNTGVNAGREGQTSGPGGGANSGGGFGPDTNTPDSPVQAGIKSIIDSIVKGVIPTPNTTDLVVDPKSRPSNMAEVKGQYPSLFDTSKFTLDNDVNFVGMDPNTLASLVTAQAACKCNIHVTEGVVTSGHVAASAHKSAYGASAVDVTISLKEINRADFISIAKRAGFARIGEYIANGKPAVFHLDMHPATNGYAANWNYSYTSTNHVNHPASADMTKGLADAQAKGPLSRGDTTSGSTNGSNTTSSGSTNTGNNPGNPNASGYQGDFSGTPSSGSSASTAGREGQTSGPGGGANSGGGFGPGTTGGSTGSNTGSHSGSTNSGGNSNTGNNPGNPNAAGYQGSGTASNAGPSQKDIQTVFDTRAPGTPSITTNTPSATSQKDIQNVFDTRVPAVTKATTPAVSQKDIQTVFDTRVPAATSPSVTKNPVNTPVDSEGYKAIIGGIKTGALNEPDTTVQDGVNSIVSGIKSGTLSGTAAADKNKEISFNTPAASTPKSTGVIGGILAYVGVTQKPKDPFSEVITTPPAGPVELTKETGGIPQDEHESTSSDVGVLCRWFGWRCPTVPLTGEDLTPVNSTVPLTEI